MLHVSIHGAGNASNASRRPKTSIAANVAVAQSCAAMCASYAKVLGNGVLTRAMLSENYAGNAHGYRIVWCFGRECVVEEQIALVGVLVPRVPVPHATRHTCETLTMTMITCLSSASITRLKSPRCSQAVSFPRKPHTRTRIISPASSCDARRCFSMEYLTGPNQLFDHSRSRP